MTVRLLRHGGTVISARPLLLWVFTDCLLLLMLLLLLLLLFRPRLTAVSLTSHHAVSPLTARPRTVALAGQE